jgi:cation-transporting ATPase 13A1
MMQATISGLFTATFFFFISHAQPLHTLSAQQPHPNIFSPYVISHARPLHTLSAQRPHLNIFSPYVILSLLGQFAIHITFLITVVKGAQAFMLDECVEP